MIMILKTPGYQMLQKAREGGESPVRAELAVFTLGGKKAIFSNRKMLNFY